MKHFTILTLFPEMFPGPLAHSVTGHALNNLWRCEAINLRDFAGNKHNRVDDEPFGGGAGMVIRAEVVMAALEHVEQNNKAGDQPCVIHLTPRGKLLTPEIAKNLATAQNITLICGRYEAIDQRLFDYYNQQHANNPILELSIGDYVLSGGELPAMVLIDSILRFVPGVLGKEESHTEESHEHGMLEHHHYTRPAEWRGHKVPETLLTGDHKKIKAFREEEAKTITNKLRPDLLEKNRKKILE
ncbi:MAG: tRNA (guanosine(37)-N1)-methyltransferase TrmD [Hydrotalea sp.]|nr:tRNA (guanosine(37)-N1)-methyltransferase TrmD [Hydrotalea sp.]